MEVSDQPQAPVALYPGKERPEPNIYNVQLWTLWSTEKPLALAGESKPCRPARSLNYLAILRYRTVNLIKVLQ